MIEAVFAFALVTGIAEYFLLCKLAVRARLTILNYPLLISMGMFAINLVIHWGTITGSMTACTALLASFVVTKIARHRHGYVFMHQGKRKYCIGTLRHDAAQLV